MGGRVATSDHTAGGRSLQVATDDERFLHGYLTADSYDASYDGVFVCQMGFDAVQIEVQGGTSRSLCRCRQTHSHLFSIPNLCLLHACLCDCVPAVDRARMGIIDVTGGTSRVRLRRAL